MTSGVVTGASRGIGRATALALGRRGCDLTLLGRTSAELEVTASELRGLGRRAEVIPCDLRDAFEVERAARAVLATSGPPDFVVHNAATIHRAEVERTMTSLWDEQLAVNLRAPFLLTRELLPELRRAGRGRLVFVSSISATLGTARAAAYAASKWGLVGFVKSLAEELTNSGLMAVAVLPGSVDTRMLEGSEFVPRMTADDVAKTLVYFCLDAPLSHNGGVIEMFGV
jgi:3-oxoacyl-[acyl-carrier protein] reductase